MIKQTVQGQVKNGSKSNPLHKVVVKGLEKNNQEVSKDVSDKKGNWELLSEKEIKKITFEKENFTKKEILYSPGTSLSIRLLEEKIIGYLDKLFFLPGEMVTAYIHSPFSFQTNLFRNGLEVKKIKHVGNFEPMLQQLPDKHFVDEGLSWKTTVKFNIPNKTSPGIYTLRLTPKNEAQKSYGITFLVSTLPKNYGKKSKLLVLASSNNWQTYNWWGGRSRYCYYEDEETRTLKKFLHSLAIKFLPEPVKPFMKKMLRKSIVVSLADDADFWQFRPLSVRRPHPDLAILNENVYDNFYDHLAPGEWRVLAWLERENYHYDIVSGYELHFNPQLLLNYETIILSTHCEYWSKEMFVGLKNFYKQGGSILNLSGNSIYREIEMQKNGDLRCVSLRFDHTVEDESSLIGVRFDNRGYFTAAPYQVKKAEHWIFKDTNVKKGDIFGKSSLNSIPSYTGGSGWETDKISKTAPEDIQLVAKGGNKKKGGADMIVRERQNGSGLLFSASSITFGGTLLIDDICSKIVSNVLDKILED